MTIRMHAGIIIFTFLTIPGFMVVITADITPSCGLPRDIPGLIIGSAILVPSTTHIRSIIPTRFMIMQLGNLKRKGNGIAGSQNAMAVLQLVAPRDHLEKAENLEIQEQGFSVEVKIPGPPALAGIKEL